MHFQADKRAQLRHAAASNSAILFKYLTLYQAEGRKKALNNLQAHARKNELRLKKALQDAHNRHIAEMTQLKKDTDEARKKLRATSTELRNIKRGLSFRLGRIITWLPRKLAGKKW